ncbi:hypothetical protein SNEBB_004204 [Seison nebaliae]|nr:hypothetical protein SNEBB_004204 [Seison nebaliae]
MSSNEKKTVPNSLKFAFGGFSGMGATVFVQPMDLLKTRMQLNIGSPEYKTTINAFKTVTKNEGIAALYNGLSAALLRQATYTTSRMGIYTSLNEYAQNKGYTNFGYKALMGMTAGGLAAIIGTPAEVSLIRMTSDGRLPVNERRGYKNVFDALIRIVREEGTLTLWRGAVPTVVRAMVINAAQLATYSQAKTSLKATGYFHDGIWLHFNASMISGLATTAASMPVDILKTRYQNMRIINGRPEYNGVMDILKSVIRNEGVFSFWKGFTPYYARLGPHTVITFIFLEQLNRVYLQL